MVATPGTIPALTPYQPGALTISGQEAVEIVSSLTATSAVSGSMLITDLVGKSPSAMTQANPSASDLVAFFSVGSALPKACTIANLGIPGGNIPSGGTANQILAKNTGSNFDASWYNITNFVAVDGVTLSTSGSATSITIAVATISSTQLATVAVLAANIATNAVGNVQFRQGGGLSVVGVSGAVGANVADITGTANQVLRVDAAGAVLGFGNVATNAMPGPYQTGTLTAFGVVYGNGTSALAASSAGSSGFLLLGQGTTSAPAFKVASLDLTVSSAGTATVVGLQGRALSSAAPSTSQVLQWNGVTWAAATALVATGFGLTSNNGTVSISTTAPPFGLDSPINVAMTASVGTGVLNISFLNNGGTVPSATNPLLIGFQNTNATNAVPLWASISTTLTMSTNTTGATLGATNSTAFRLWVALFYQNATNVMPALINCSNSATVFRLSETTLQTTVAIGSTATSAGVFYSPNGTSVGNAPFRVVGYVEWNAGLTTAGTYSTAPTGLNLVSAKSKMPGDVVQIVSLPGAVATVSFTTALATTNVSASITPTSAINIVHFECSVSYTNSTTTATNTSQIYRGATAVSSLNRQVGSAGMMSFIGLDLPQTTAAVTYVLKAAASTGTAVIPAATGDNAELLLIERMG